MNGGLTFFRVKRMFRFYNANPEGKMVGDCVVRAISMIQRLPWDEVYYGICSEGAIEHNMPSANEVWGKYLKRCGFRRRALPDTCPECYTVRDFCYEHPYGEYILATGTHVCAVIDGDYYDTWDSGDETPIYYWRKE